MPARGGKVIPQGMIFERVDEHAGQGLDGGFIVRVADVEDPSVAAVAPVFDDAEQAFDAVLDVGEAALLLAAVHELDRRPFGQVEDQLGDGPGTADAGRFEAVQPGPIQLKGRNRVNCNPWVAP
jgi:hypothetical protein